MTNSIASVLKMLAVQDPHCKFVYHATYVMLHGFDGDLFSHAKIASDGDFYLLLEKTTSI